LAPGQRRRHKTVALFAHELSAIFGLSFGHGICRMSDTEHQIAETEDQLRGDFSHLGKLRSSIRNAVETVRRGQRAYADSVELIARIERHFGRGNTGW